MATTCMCMIGSVIYKVLLKIAMYLSLFSKLPITTYLLHYAEGISQAYQITFKLAWILHVPRLGSS